MGYVARSAVGVCFMGDGSANVQIFAQVNCVKMTVIMPFFEHKKRAYFFHSSENVA